MDVREAFTLQLSRISRGWRARLDERLRDTGLTQARWTTLLHLARGAEGMTQRELARRLGVEGATIGRLLDGLEKQALIERRDVSGDRRAYHIHLTAAAQPVLKEINSIAASLRRELLAGISADDLTTCTAVLRDIGERLEKHPEDR
ncbi:MAG: MarR family transcriptional regulator [Betaproteobacteria bacterium]|nr:MAG: MarR family transcriptional regulator [Betaproteobacteria bacterium]